MQVALRTGEGTMCHSMMPMSNSVTLQTFYKVSAPACV